MPSLFHQQIAPPCTSNAQCSNKGTFCSRAGGWTPIGRGGCVFCGTYAPLPFEWRQEADGTTTTWNFPEDPTQPRKRQLKSDMYNKTAALEVCRDPKKSIFIYPPDGHGPKPPRAGYKCYDMSGTGGDPDDWVVKPVKCGREGAYYEEYVLNWYAPSAAAAAAAAAAAGLAAAAADATPPLPAGAISVLTGAAWRDRQAKLIR